MPVSLVARVVLCMIAAAVPEQRSSDLTECRVVRDAMWSMLAKVRYGFSDYEAAAFIVRKPDGNLCAIAWPEAVARDCQSWRGAFPRGVVAIAHTHPNWLPSPSRVDLLAAQKSRVPVYVVTRREITRTDGRSIQVVARGNWREDS